MKQNNQQRPTPETDAEVKRIKSDQRIFVCEEFDVLADFARNLEHKRDGAREELEVMREAIKRASVALDMADDEIYPPSVNCSCHISPPCNDCVDHSQARETKEFIKAALAKLQPFLKP